MPSITQQLAARGCIRPPAFLPMNVMYETQMGSVAYGVAAENSDRDIYGFAMPPKDHLFPHLAGEIAGFGAPAARFEQFQVAHITDPSAAGGKGIEYDLSIYNIAKYFTLCMECNPNMIDSLFTPQECVVHITRVGSLVREQRRLFLHKGVWVRFKAYAYSQLHKMSSADPTGKRRQVRQEFGYDVKFAYHVVRLLYECEQLLMFGDMDIRRDREHLKSIRRGEISEQEIRDWAASKEKQLEKLYLESALPDVPDRQAIRTLLLQCLEEHYGCLDRIVANPDAAAVALREITAVVDRFRQCLKTDGP
ncbi:MAG: nucleotidyltransferase domain-containing protein [Planctomycetia bacterium]